MRIIFLRNGFLKLLLGGVMVLGLITGILAITDFWQSAPEQHDFVGDAEIVHYPGLHFHTLQSHQFQNYVETLVAKKLRLRHYFIRIHNQLYFSLFKKSFAEQGGVIVGKNGELFQKQYIQAYCHPAPLSPTALTDWANRLQQMQAFFQKRGITFIYLITPSKAEYKPQAVPERFHCTARGLNPQLRLLEQALRARHLAYVNGPALMKKADQQWGISLFPRGGTHWNWLGAAVAAQDLFQRIDRERQGHWRPLQLAVSLGTIQPFDSDADLLHLMNLLWPEVHEQTPQVHGLNMTSAQLPLTVTFIGGSFNDNLVKLMTQEHVFSKVHYYFYLKSERTFKTNEKDPIDRRLDQAFSGVLKTLEASQVVILEENSSLLAQSEQGKKLFQLIQQATPTAAPSLRAKRGNP